MQVVKPFALDKILREQILEGKTICNKEETNWHRHVELNGPGPEAYAAYNIASIELEERLCSK